MNIDTIIICLALILNLLLIKTERELRLDSVQILHKEIDTLKMLLR